MASAPQVGRGPGRRLLLVAPAIAALENPADISIISSRNAGPRAALKFTAATEATLLPRWESNSLWESWLPVMTELKADHQLLTEAILCHPFHHHSV
ncbi:rCG45801 [Rattus norvegicus]|uniref:RCG45801 n=1 Tax=Rattus norvegicus TaxID=10116 RepID=A6JU25_RAT|nr:rCG45801 [Rattus norvegicus]